MAQRDLDAALQLLAERAQYITGASGAAIALRRDQHNDMLCRASVGSNAPGLGALLSAEAGLSGESVRTRLPLRCDDTERDPRVNRDGCRELGIASVVVMPIIRDDRVLGVFELFSGTPRAFGERDLSALQRLGGMVDTAVKLAETAQGLVFDAPGDVQESGQPSTEESSDQDEEMLMVNAGIEEVETEISSAEPKTETLAADVAAPPVVADATVEAVLPSLEPAPKVAPRKPVMWSAAAPASPDAVKSVRTEDQSHVPPVLRNLHKCWACGFPVSEGRKLCVECEEKQWRGQLRVQNPAGVGFASAAMPRAASPPQAFAAAAGAAVPARRGSVASGQKTKSSSADSSVGIASTTTKASEVESDLPILSGGIEPSQSWLAANKYIIGALLVAAGTIAAIAFLR